MRQRVKDRMGNFEFRTITLDIDFHAAATMELARLCFRWHLVYFDAQTQHRSARDNTKAKRDDQWIVCRSC